MRVRNRWIFLLLMVACPSALQAGPILFEETAAAVYLQFGSQGDVRPVIMARAEQQIYAAVGQYISDAGYTPHVLPDSAVFMGMAVGIFEPQVASLTIEKIGSGYEASASVNGRLDSDTLAMKVRRFVDNPLFFSNALSGRVQAQALIERLDAFELELNNKSKEKGERNLAALKKKIGPDSRACLLRLRALALNDEVIRYGEKGLQEDPGRILDLLNQAIDYDKSNPWLFLHRGRAHSQLGSPTAALGDYNRAIAIDPYSPLAFYFRGLLYNGVKAWDLAIRDLNTSISLDLEFVWPYVQRGIARREIGKYKPAFQDFDRAAQLEPENPQIYNERGLTNLAMEAYEDALYEFDLAVQIAPDLAASYVNRGKAFQGMGQQEAACSSWRKACELSSCEMLRKFVDAGTCIYHDASAAQRWSKKSYEHATKHQWHAAIAAATLSMSFDPDLIYPYINRCWALAEIQAFDSALHDCARAISLNPKAAAAHNNRGMVYQKMGEHEKAGKDYLRACSLGLEIGCTNYLEVKRQ